MGQFLDAVIGYQKTVFDADGSDRRNDELRFERENHTRNQRFLRPRREYGRFVDLDSDPMADKSGLLAVSHKIIGQPCVGGDPHGQVVKIGRRNSRRRRLLDPPLNLQRSVMRSIRPIVSFPTEKTRVMSVI